MTDMFGFANAHGKVVLPSGPNLRLVPAFYLSRQSGEWLPQLHRGYGTTKPGGVGDGNTFA
jgi:hypothetical protein